MLPADALANTKKWRKPVHDIQVIRAEWNDKMKKYEENGYSEKEVLNISTQERQFADIEFLKKTKSSFFNFTISNKVSDYLDSDNNDAVKNKQLYTEVRLAKRT